MQIDHRDRDHGRALDARAGAPVGAQPPGFRAHRERDGQAALEIRHHALRIARAGRVLRLVGGKAERTALVPGQLPDQPVRALDEAVGAAPEMRRLGGELCCLGEQPLAGHLAAEIGQEVAAGTVDRVGMRLGRAVLPELDVGVRLTREQHGQRRAVLRGRHGRACGEAEPDRLDRPAASQSSQYVLRRLDIVGGVLQGPGRRQRRAIRDLARHDAVPVGMRVAVELLAALRIEQDAARQLRAVVQPDEVGGGHAS